MCNGSQAGLAALTFVAPRTKSRAQSPLEHRVDGLHLPSLPIFGLIPSEPLLHASPPAARRQLVSWSSPLRRDDRPNAMRADAAMDPLGVEVRVGQQCADSSAVNGLAQSGTELHQVRTWPSTGDCGEDHVTAAVDHQDN